MQVILDNSKTFLLNFENRTTTLSANPFSNSIKEIKSMYHRCFLTAMSIIVKNGNSVKTLSQTQKQTKMSCGLIYI